MQVLAQMTLFHVVIDGSPKKLYDAAGLREPSYTHRHHHSKFCNLGATFTMTGFEVKTRTCIQFDSEAGVYVSSCPEFGLVSQGLTEEEAERAIQSAINLFLIACYEHEILHSALKQQSSGPAEAQAV